MELHGRHFCVNIHIWELCYIISTKECIRTVSPLGIDLLPVITGLFVTEKVTNKENRPAALWMG